MAATFDEIGSVTADGTTSAIEITGIDQTYDDLQVIFEFFVNGVGSTQSTYISVNSDTATSTYNSDTMILEGSGSWTYQEDYDAYSGWRMINCPTNSGSGTPYHWANIIIDMMQYTATRTKSFIAHRCTFNESGTNSAIGAAGLGYRGTSAISSIKLSSDANIGSGSTMTIYGITNS
tara:strand:+ start:1067 stop:1597 length:531 start_codon:yes stop_codon:yes gene_type:complete